jgi:endonuclease/exonuclease/phosphatase family metal-dependent hydrolase
MTQALTIKIVSLNMWVGGKLFPAILDFLKVQDADVVALQEVSNGNGAHLSDQYRSMEVLKDSLGYPYQEFAQIFVLETPEGQIPLGSAVLSKFPLNVKPSRFFVEPDREVYQDLPEQWPLMPRMMQHVELNTPAGTIDLFNIHGVWDLAGDSASPARLKMKDIVLEEIKGRPKVLLTGDSNASQGNPIWQDVGRRLTNAMPGVDSTFNMRRKDSPGYATAAVDVLYVSPEIKVLAKAVPDVDISDHLPLVAELDIP